MNSCCSNTTQLNGKGLGLDEVKVPHAKDLVGGERSNGNPLPEFSYHCQKSDNENHFLPLTISYHCQKSRTL